MKRPKGMMKYFDWLLLTSTPMKKFFRQKKLHFPSHLWTATILSKLCRKVGTYFFFLVTMWIYAALLHPIAQSTNQDVIFRFVEETLSFLHWFMQRNPFIISLLKCFRIMLSLNDYYLDHMCRLFWSNVTA